jgi:hypothetical protein
MNKDKFFKSSALTAIGLMLLAGCFSITEVEKYESEDVSENSGEPTYVTFTLNTMDPTVYSGDYDQAGSANENAIHDVAMFLYKLDGTPEAMGYLSAADYAINNKISLRCYAGDKLVYLAVNTGGDRLVASGAAGTSTPNTAAAPWLGVDWTATSTTPPAKQFSALNSPLWSTGASTFQIQTTASYTPTSTTADGLIKALSGDGVPSGGVLFGSNGSGYFMSNWGDATYQNTDDVASGTNYVSTCKFTIKPSITALDSRSATPDETNSNQKNALRINVQRALAQIAVETIPTAVLNNAGSGDAQGVFVPEAKWAIGNINTSTYPFQQFDGTKVKSTLYDSIGSIPIAGAMSPNLNWSKQMDNSRWIPAPKTYEQQNLTVTEVLNQINSCTSNQAFGITNKALVTENNNKNTYNVYSTFILYAGKYKPNKYITDVAYGPILTTVTGTPAAEPSWSTNDGKDTLYYIAQSDTTGVFIWGKVALKRYIGWVILAQGAAYDPAATTAIDATHTANINAVISYINLLKSPIGNTQARLQEYYHGYCFYMGWISDASAAAPANKILVRRNHIYQISITNLRGPGIANPNDIIQPHLYGPEPINESETYKTSSTVSINVMHWHVINQWMQNGLNN